MVDDLKEYAETVYTDREFAERCGRYSYCRPFTKESLLYRELFEKYYPGQAGMIVDYWMPNRAWPHCDVSDPSAVCWPTTAQAGSKGKAAQSLSLVNSASSPLRGAPYCAGFTGGLTSKLILAFSQNLCIIKSDIAE